MERLLRKVPGLSEHERFLFARSLSATPDERWEMHQAHLHSLGLLTRLQRKRIRFQFVGMTAAILQGVPARLTES